MVINELIMAFWKKFAEKQRANFTISDVLTIHLKEDVVRGVFAAKVVELFEFAPTKKTVHFRREYTLPGMYCLQITVALGDYKSNFLFSCLAVDGGSFSGKSYKIYSRQIRTCICMMITKFFKYHFDYYL